MQAVVQSWPQGSSHLNTKAGVPAAWIQDSGEAGMSRIKERNTLRANPHRKGKWNQQDGVGSL